MENLTIILDRIRADGKEAADKVLAVGEKNAAEVLTLYEKQAAMEEAAVLGRADKEAEEIRQRSLSQAGIKRRNRRLSAKRAALLEAFEKALKSLSELSAGEKQAFYRRLTEGSGSVSGELLLNGKDKAAFGKALIKDLGGAYVLSADEGSFLGGLVIIATETELNCTFEALIESARKEMEAEIAAILFS